MLKGIRKHKWSLVTRQLQVLVRFSLKVKSEICLSLDLTIILSLSWYGFLAHHRVIITFNFFERWADKLAETGRLQHAETEDGENLAFAGPTLSAQKAADMWYDEIKDYDFSKPGFTGGTGTRVFTDRFQFL